jgi:hypothetical protein
MRVLWNNVWNIVRKDWKLLWVPISTLTALQIAAGAWCFTIASYDFGTIVLGVLRAALFGAGLIAIVLVVRQDVIPGVRQDWLIRPIPRSHMLLAKFAGVLLFVHGPMLLGNTLAELGSGASVAHAFSTAGIQGALMLGAFSLPWLACASLYSSPLEMVIAAAVFSTITILPAATSFGWARAMAWLPRATVGGMVLLAATAALLWTHVGRRLLPARLTLAAALFLATPLAFQTRIAAFAIQKWMSPAVPAESLQITYDPSLTTPASQSYWERIQVLAPVRAHLKPEDLPLRIDVVRSRGGELGGASGAMLWNVNDGEAFRQIFFPYRQRKALEKGLPVEIIYSITTFRRSQGPSISAAAGRQMAPGFGRCVNEVNDTRSAISGECLADSALPSCYTLDIPGSSGAQNQHPTGSECRPDYSPVNVRWGLDNIEPRFVTFGFSFRDVQGNLAKLNDAQLAEKRVLATFYEPAAHFERRVTIPNFRIESTKE